VQDFEDVVDDECVYMGNSTTARVMGKGKILLKFASGKLLSLSNALSVLSIRKNLSFWYASQQSRIENCC